MGWGKGFLMTGWFGGKEPVEPRKAGNYLLMPVTLQQSKTIVAAVEHGSLSEDQRIEEIISLIVYHKAPAHAQGPFCLFGYCTCFR